MHGRLNSVHKMYIFIVVYIYFACGHLPVTNEHHVLQQLLPSPYTCQKYELRIAECITIL